MKEEKLMVVLALDSASMISGKGQVKEEILNTVVRQTRKLHTMDYDVSIFLLHPAKYCQQESLSENLRVAFGKIRVVKIFAEAFLRKNIEICVLDSDMQTAKATMLEAFACGIVPLVVGNSPCGEDEIYFSDFCKAADANIVVIGGSDANERMKKPDFSLLFPQSMKPRLAIPYESNFFLKAVEQESQRAHYMFE